MKRFTMLFLVSLLAVSCSKAPTPNNNNLAVPFDEESNEAVNNAATAYSGQSAALPETCQDKTEGTPVITELLPRYGNAQTKIKISGCNFLGFEGDKVAWIENQSGEKGYLGGARDSDSKNMAIQLSPRLCKQDVSYSGAPCPAELLLRPGKYKIYVSAWGKYSNKVEFEIK